MNILCLRCYFTQIITFEASLNSLGGLFKIQIYWEKFSWLMYL